MSRITFILVELVTFAFIFVIVNYFLKMEDGSTPLQKNPEKYVTVMVLVGLLAGISHYIYLRKNGKIK